MKIGLVNIVKLLGATSGEYFKDTGKYFTFLLFNNAVYLYVVDIIKLKLCVMKQITLNIDETKFKTFVNFIKTLDYVSVSDEIDIPLEQQQEVD
jgi:hypothetical protein